MYANILLDQAEPGIYLLTINRPKSLNALNAQTLDEIAAAVAHVGQDSAARALGFAPQAQTLEVHGLCAKCARAA